MQSERITASMVTTYAREWCQQGALPLPADMNLYPGNLRAFVARMVPCQGAGCHAQAGDACMTRQNGAGWLHVVRERDARPLLSHAWQVIFAADGIAVESGWTL